MIKPNELRIGNLLRQHENGEFLIVDELGMVGSENHIHTSYLKKGIKDLTQSWKAEPIPLTEEILLSCKDYEKWDAFGDNNWGGYLPFELIKFAKLMIRYYKGDLIFTLCYVSEKKDTYTPVKRLNLKIKYLYQLQNLYFALTGQELNVDNLK